MSTRSYLCRFICATALSPSTATSIVTPKPWRNLLESLHISASSSTRRILGGIAHPGTYVLLRTRSVLGGRTIVSASCSSVGSAPSNVQFPFGSSTALRGSRLPTVKIWSPSCSLGMRNGSLPSADCRWSCCMRATVSAPIMPVAGSGTAKDMPWLSA